MVLKCRRCGKRIFECKCVTYIWSKTEGIKMEMTKLKDLIVVLIKCRSCGYTEKMALHDRNSNRCICMTCKEVYETEKVEI